ncbi:MAG TPA: thiamine phosphate synthase [Chromatiales bacterium]|nr:thiamine phosphate synthase [Chromatiales bacterium]
MRLRGLYVLTDTALTPRPVLAARVEAAVRGGARLVQYRNKDRADPGRARDVRALIEVCRPHGVPVIVNDDVELARATGADGVHLGREDLHPQAARRRLGAEAIIGVSCYDDLARAVEAERHGASYVAFGSFYASPTKPHAVHADLALLQRARARLACPICAIGGITVHNAHALIERGADLIAVVSAVWKAADPEAAARALCARFTSSPGSR